MPNPAGADTSTTAGRESRSRRWSSRARGTTPRRRRGTWSLLSSRGTPTSPTTSRLPARRLALRGSADVDARPSPAAHALGLDGPVTGGCEPVPNPRVGRCTLRRARGCVHQSAPVAARAADRSSAWGAVEIDVDRGSSCPSSCWMTESDTPHTARSIPSAWPSASWPASPPPCVLPRLDLADAAAAAVSRTTRSPPPLRSMWIVTGSTPTPVT